MRISRWMAIGLATALASLSLTTGVLAADEGDQELEQVVQQLQAENPGLTKDEALEIAGLAAADAQGPLVREGAVGPATEGNAAPGAPAGLGLSFGQSDTLTPQEQTLMNEVNTFEQNLAQKGLTPDQIHNEIETQFGERFRSESFDPAAFQPGERDDFRLQELYNQGRPVEGALEQRGGFEHGGPVLRESGGIPEFGGREWGQESGRPETSFGGSTLERDSNAQGKEHGQKETEHRGGGSEREQQTVERPTYEREQPMVERPTYEREQPTMEHPGSEVK